KDHRIYLAYLKLITASRYKENNLRLPVAKLMRNYRVLLYGIRNYAENKAAVEAEIDGQLSELYSQVKQAVDVFRTDISKKPFKFEEAKEFEKQMTEWAQKVEDLRREYLPNLSDKVVAEVEKTQVVSLVEQAAAQGTPNIFVTDDGTMYLFAATKPLGPKQKTRPKSREYQPVVHIDPNCPALKHQHGAGFEIETQEIITDSQNLARDIGDYTLCPSCPHNLPGEFGKGSGTPIYRAWPDIRAKFKGKGLTEEELPDFIRAEMIEREMLDLKEIGKAKPKPKPASQPAVEDDPAEEEELGDIIAEEQLLEEAEKSGDVEKGPDTALISNPGGIDLNPKAISIERKGEGFKYNFDMRSLDPQYLGADGFVPVIYNVTPIPNLPFYLGVKNSGKEQELSKVIN
ncbi:MAG: hypothetical protein HQL27_09645, partial [Candidatus Omnitrophica bacterium]|nr:hypothetical protein [Candidatus Omnitrophota bacterium]